MPVSPYPDTWIDDAIRSAFFQLPWARMKKARERMRAIRQAAIDAGTATPFDEANAASIRLALDNRAKDILGTSDPNGFYLPPGERK